MLDHLHEYTIKHSIIMLFYMYTLFGGDPLHLNLGSYTIFFLVIQDIRLYIGLGVMGWLGPRDSVVNEV